MLRKYYLVFKYMLIRTLQFRAEIVIYTMLDLIPFFVLFFLWKAVYSGNEIINTYSITDIVQYYLLVVVVQRFTATHFEGWRSQEIRMGQIDYFLTRPFSYINEIVSKEVGGKLVSLAFSLPVLGIFYYLISKVFSLSKINLELKNILIFLLLLAAGYAIQIIIALWIVLLTFWIEGSSGLEHFKWIIISLFSGSTIPFEFMPGWLQKLFEVLPLKYVSYVPVRVMQGKLTLIPKDYFAILVTLLIMFIISKILWSKAKYKYASAGG